MTENAGIEFFKDSDDLLNQICDTYHDELKVLADKYGKIEVKIKIVDDFLELNLVK